MLGGPVLVREVRGQFRSGKTLAAAMAIAFFTGGLVLLRWPSAGSADMMSQRSFEVFRPLAYAMLTATLLAVPAFPATSIVREWRQGTLAMLLHSPIRVADIYFGKFWANVVVAVVLLTATLPALTASYAMGGVSLVQHIAPLLATLFGVVVLYTAVSLWISSRTRTSDASLRGSYAAMVLIAIGSVIIGAVLSRLPGTIGTIGWWIRSISPIPLIGQIVGDRYAVGAMDVSVGDATGTIASVVVRYLVLCLAGAAVFSLLTILRLGSSAVDRSRATGTVTDDQSRWVRIIRRFAFLVDPNRRSSGIPRWLNPVMVKEFRTRRFGRMHWLLRLVSVCAVLSMTLAVVATTGTVSWGVERVATVMVIVQMALLVLIGPSLASSQIAGELESGGWDILRTTPMSMVRILSGKVFSVVWTLLLILMATLPGYLVMIMIQPTLVPQVQRVLVCLGITALVVLSISLCVSAMNRRTATATAINYLVLLLVFAGTLLVWSAQDRPFGHGFVQAVLSINPAAAALAEIQTPGFEDYQLIPTAWIVGLGVTVIAGGLVWLRCVRLTRMD
ncbi:ABC transporter permease [Crateriforma conspicua]|uniref:ABC-2 family transporter protein n=1 Tax=Crateriforma conspicua TaxID=2527996 RepID=A0A5C5Y8R4_9PLAN|nr:ABC transporter permease subunit [Crateriforma conspicua]TWT71298.1 ABC-2 family transporter protein [Crateriforma conspicua]